MGIVSRTISGGSEERSINSLEELLQVAGAIQTTSSGQAVTIEGAQSLTAVYNAIRVISETAATLPLFLYRRTDSGREVARDHPLFRLMHDSPGQDITSAVWEEAFIANMNGWGNGYAKIGFNNRGIAGKLDVVKASKLTVFEDEVTGRKKYEIRRSNVPNEVVPAGRMIHVPLWGFDGVVGFSPIQKCREAIGLNMAAQKYGADFFQNDSRGRAVIKHPNSLSPEAYDRLKQDWQNAYSGESGWHEAAILEEDADVANLTIPQEDAQFIQTRKFQVREVARMFNIQPHLIKDLEDSTFSNIETQSLEFVKYTLRPILVRIEQELNQKLIPSEDQGELFFEHKIDGLMRADSETRSDYFAKAIQNGWMTQNEARSLENMNPIPGGDRIYIQKNMVPVGEKGGDALEPPEPEEGTEEERIKDVVDLMLRRDNEEPEEHIETRSAAERRQVANSFRPVWEDAAARVVRREVNDVLPIIENRLPQRDIDGFLSDLEEFLREDHVDFVEQQLRPVAQSEAEAVLNIHRQNGDVPEDFDADEFLDDYIQERAEFWISVSEGQMRGLLDEYRIEARQEEGDLTANEAAEQRLDEWGEKRAGKAAQVEATSTESAVTKSVFRAAGVQEIQWVSIGSSCRGCRALDGRVVGIDQAFTGQDEDITGDGWFNGQVNRPPLHSGCWTPDHEVYAVDGWKPITQVRKADILWTMDMETREMTKDVVQGQWKRHHNGEVGHYSNRTIDLKLTPDHEMAIVTDWRGKHGEEYLEKRRLDEMADSSKIPRAPEWSGPNPETIRVANREWPAKKAMRFLGWFISEGNICDHVSGLYQPSIKQHNEDIYGQIVDLIEDLFDRVWVADNQVYFPLEYHDPLASYLCTIGKSSEKKIPPHLLEYGSDTLMPLFETLVSGDGHTNNAEWNAENPEKQGDFRPVHRFYTSSKSLVDGITELAQKVGKRVTVRKREARVQVHENGTYEQNQPTYDVGFGRNKWSTYKHKNIEWKDYEGDVIGFSMLNNPVVLVKRNNKTAWVGNCDCVLSK